ncbi:hypothetical protein [Shewanella gaetbuli]|uniref:Orphan protein secreted protein n=1 Tax=Shewanella gaetbuli TaxID=220752 RepID=A0A9X1ZIM9_9GAMM|nr:hypothetical protein [Shewanella gaetbuli]MCL1142166.1 hypothetical protein [Shewanella gaetbuli]
MKNNYLLTLALTTISGLYSAQTFAQCELNPDILNASYQLTSSSNQTAKTVHQSQINLWRQGNTVAHQYPQTDITESWYLLANQQIKPSRYFDGYQRAIEYQPGEVVHGKTEKDWSYRYQLVSNKLIEQLTLVNESGQGCKRTQRFSKNSPNGLVTLTWLPELKLISQFSWQQGKGKQQVTEDWKLIEVGHNPATIKAFFNNLSQYKTTDYADIGDDHSDPFLTQMVTLGFVEHGASGFYDVQGHALEANGHQHSH